MKIAIMSDLHLGYNDDALPQARQALKKSRDLGADIVIIAGDLFDVRVPKQEIVHEAVKLFTEHNNLSGRAAIAIAGTHERRTKGLSNIIEVLDSAGVLQNCHNFPVIIEKNGEKVAVLGMAGVPEEYAKSVVQAANFKPLPNSVNVFIFHQTLREIIPFSDLFMCCEDLPRGFDLYVDGHIHWRRELKAHDALLLLPGSTVITQMKKNETEQKGLWMYDTATKAYEFHYIASRPFYFRELHFEKATAAQIEETVRKSIAGTINENQQRQTNQKPLIKIKLLGTLATGLSAANIDSSTMANGLDVEIYIDKEFDVAQILREKVELLRRLREEQKTVHEMGLTLLKAKLQAASFSGNVEELYSTLAEREIEKAVQIAKKVINRDQEQKSHA